MFERPAQSGAFVGVVQGYPLNETASTLRRLDRRDEICLRALGALDRLYRFVDFDEPDLGANVTFMVSRVSLLRLASSDAPITRTVADHTLEFIQEAEGIDDAATAVAWFPGFANEVLVRLGHRARGLDAAFGLPGQPSGDSSATASVRPF